MNGQPHATIVAPATPPVPGGIGILRLSGPLSLELGRRIASEIPPDPSPRHAYFARFLQGGRVLDEGLFLYFRAPHSFTGEDVVELQAHGSPQVLSLLQAEILADGRARLAEPGEFSRRAFLNGRLDLARAEAVADLVSADNEAAARAAAAQACGALSAKIREIRDLALALQADLEAELNFPDEADGASEGVGDRLGRIMGSCRALLDGVPTGQKIRQGARVVLYGPVNAGKSTLFNCLVGQDRALVDDEPGTTRDVLEAKLEWDGLPLILCDTAGIRVGATGIEARGISRARRALQEADLSVLLVPPDADPAETDGWLNDAKDTPVLRVRSKADLSSKESGELSVSAHSGLGITELRQAISMRLWSQGSPGAISLLSERHADALRRGLAGLERATAAAEESTLDVVAGELRVAVESWGEITGETASQDLLDAVFSRFCIGK